MHAFTLLAAVTVLLSMVCMIQAQSKCADNSIRKASDFGCSQPQNLPASSPPIECLRLRNCSNGVSHGFFAKLFDEFDVEQTKRDYYDWLDDIVESCIYEICSQRLWYGRALAKLRIHWTDDLKYMYWNVIKLLYLAGDITCKQLSCCGAFDNSCAGNVGGIDCFCDAACQIFGDCCSDYAILCIGLYKEKIARHERRGTHHAAQYTMRAHQPHAFSWTPFSYRFV